MLKDLKPVIASRRDDGGEETDMTFLKDTFADQSIQINHWRNKMRRIFVFIAMFVLIAVFIASCQKAEGPEGGSKETTNAEVQVKHGVEKQGSKEAGGQGVAISKSEPGPKSEPKSETAESERKALKEDEISGEAVEPAGAEVREALEAKKPTKIKSLLTEEEQEFVDSIIQDAIVTPNAFKSREQAKRFLRILLKAEPDDLRFFQEAEADEGEDIEQRKKELYGDAIASAIYVIDPREKEGEDLIVRVLKTRWRYPKAMSAAARAIKFTRNRAVIPLLREVVKHPDPGVRLEAAAALLSLGDGDTALPVLEELALKEGWVQALYYLFRGPGEIIDERGYEIVEKALKSPRAEVRISAVKLLYDAKKINKEEAEEIALQILEELKDKKLEDYGLMRDPKNITTLIPIPGSKISNVEAIKQLHFSNSRACEYTISFLATLRSVASVAILKHIKEHNTDPIVWYNCKSRDANNALETIEGGVQ